MKRPLLIVSLTVCLLVSVFSLYSFRNQEESVESYAMVVLTKTRIYINYGNGRHENIDLKADRFVENDNTTIGVFNKMSLQGYTLATSAGATDGSIYFMFKK